MQITKALVLFSLFYISCVQAAPARRRKGQSTADTPQPAIPPPPSPPVVHSHGDIVGARAKEYENSKVDSIHPGVVVGGPDASNNYKVAMISKNLPGSPPRESIATYQPGTSMEGSVSHNAPKVVPGNKLKPWLEKGSGSGRRQPPLAAAKLAELKQAISSCPTGEALSRRGCVPRKPTAKKEGAKAKGGAKVIAMKGGSKGPGQRPTQRQEPLVKTGGTKKPSSAKPNAQSVKKGGTTSLAQKPVPIKAGAKKPAAKPEAQPLKKGGTKSPAQKPVAKNAGAKKPIQKPAAKPKAQPLKKGGAKSLAQKPVSKNAGAKKPVQRPAAKPKAQPLKKGGAKPQAQKSVPKSVGTKSVQKPLAKPPAQKGGAKPPTQKPVPKNAGAKKPVQKPPAKPAAQPVKNGGAKPPAQKPAAKLVSKPPAKPAQRKH